jgi:hypothetical protein
MTAPAHAVERWVGEYSPLRGEGAALALMFVVALGVLPALLLTTAAFTTKRVARAQTGLRGITIAFVYTLVPLGFATWAAHYGFHLLTGVFTVVPVVQSAAGDLFGSMVLGEPAWRFTGMRSGLVFPVQVGLVVLGAAGSLSLVWATARRDYPERQDAAAAPWVVVTLALASLALWVLAQPMDMRGMAAG